MSIKTEITRIEKEVSEQADLMAQIQTALAGKAAGSEGGGSVETCTVMADNSGMNYEDFSMVYTSYSNGEFQTVVVPSTGEYKFVLTDVVVGSKIVFCAGFDACSEGMNPDNSEFSDGVSYDKLIAVWDYMGMFVMVFTVDVTGSGVIAIW